MTDVNARNKDGLLRMTWAWTLPMRCRLFDQDGDDDALMEENVGSTLKRVYLHIHSLLSRSMPLGLAEDLLQCNVE